MPALRGRSVLASEDCADGVPYVRPPNLGDCGNDLPGHTQAIGRLVSRHVLGDNSKDRRQRIGIAASAGIEKLQNCLDMAAQTASRDGPPWTRPADRAGRGG